MNSEDIALTITFTILLIPDIILNVLVCLAIKNSRNLHTPMNYLIANLALCDIFIGIFIFPRHVINQTFTHPVGETGDDLCKFATGGGYLWISVTSSGFFLTAIAFERYVAVVYPETTRYKMTNRSVHVLSVSVWTFSVIVNCPSSLVLVYDEKANFCMENWPAWVSPKAYVSVIFIIGTSSVIFMYVLYSRVLYRFWRRRKNVTDIGQGARLRVRTRVTRMLVVMTIVHTICRTPNYTFYLLSYFNPNAKYGSYVYNITVILILLNSFSHPLLIFWQIRTIRKGVAKLWNWQNCCCWPSRIPRTIMPTKVYSVPINNYNMNSNKNSRNNDSINNN